MSLLSVWVDTGSGKAKLKLKSSLICSFGAPMTQCDLGEYLAQYEGGNRFFTPQSGAW